MPLMIVTEGAVAEAAAPTGSLELVNRRCRLRDYQEIEVPSFNLTGDFIAYASPDSTYAVTKRLMDAAQKSIVIGIYDFTAGYMKDILLNALQRGVKISLMLDLDGVKGELPIFEELARFGVKAVPAPSCASERAKFFRSCHEKVIVIDDIWTLVQSGNYSKNSIPLNEKDGGDPDSFVKGNRDMGLAVRSKPLAAFFTKILRSDMKLELDAATDEALRARRAARQRPIELVEAVPEALPSRLFRSKTFNPQGAIRVIPVLSPDNYMQVVPDFLRSATRSIFIEQQYIRGTHSAIEQLLEAIRDAMGKHPGLDVRIVLGKIFSADDLEAERENLRHIRDKFGLKLDTNIRFIDTKRFVHCHNKMIVVDNQAALISSQNWSNAAVLENREAGLLIRAPELARYYAEIFESDWSTASKTLPRQARLEFATPETLIRENVMEASLGDYVEV